MKKLKIGIIGCGSISMQRHSPEYAANPNSEIAGFYDPVVERAQALQKKFGGQVYHTIEEMLADGAIDAVSVCTSNATHAPLSIAAMKAGKHVLCEKPMAVTMEDCLEMGRVAEQTGKNLMIGHNQRFAPAHVKAKQIIQSGELGRVISFRTAFGHRGPEYWSADKSKKTWFFDKKAAFLGATADLGIHKLDLISWLLDDSIGSLSAFCETLDKKDEAGDPISVDDNMICLLKMKKGAMGTLTVSWTYYGAEDNSTVLYFENGIVRVYDNDVYSVEIEYRNGERAYFKVGAIQTNTDLVQASSGVIDAFVESIVTKSAPAVTYQDAIGIMRAIFACVQSSKDGSVVRL